MYAIFCCTDNNNNSQNVFPSTPYGHFGLLHMSTQKTKRRIVGAPCKKESLGPIIHQNGILLVGYCPISIEGIAVLRGRFSSFMAFCMANPGDSVLPSNDCIS
jgi:hypothetical protein